MKQGLLSVIIPVYNAEPYLTKCIDSVLSQDVPLEVLLIDDGSTDGSANMCKRYAERDTRIRYFRKENGGVSSARNVGLDNMLGEFVTFVDSDDQVISGSYQTMLNEFADSATDLVCCGIVRQNEQGQIVDRYGILPGRAAMTPIEAMDSCLASDGPVGFTVYAKIFRTSLFSGTTPIRFPEGRLMEEAYILPHIFIRCRNIIHIGEPGYVYALRSDSYTTKPLSEECYAIYDTAKRYESELPALFPQFDMGLLFRWRVESCTNIYRTALKQQNVIDPKVFERIRREFRRIFRKGLFASSISLRTKLLMVDTVSRFFLLRQNTKQHVRRGGAR